MKIYNNNCLKILQQLIDEIKESKSLKVNKKITYNNDNLTFFQ